MRWQNNNTILLWIVHWCQLCSNHSFAWLSCLMSQECLCLPHCQQFASIFERGGKTVHGKQDMIQSEIRTNWKQLLIIAPLSCVLIFTSEALCISCFPSPVENGFIECGTAVKKTTFNLRDNTSTGLEQRSSDAKHRKTYGDCLNQGWISHSFRFFCILWILMPRFRDFQQRTSEEGTNNQGFAADVGSFGEVAEKTMTRAVTRSKAVDVTATFFLADFWAAEMG